MNERNYPERLLHRINLDAIGGVEVSFLHYQAYRQLRSSADSVLVGESVLPRFEAALNEPIRTIWRSSLKHWHGIRLPRAARRLRARHAARVIESSRPQAILAWNHIGNREIADIAKASHLPLLHYEHGEAWRPSARDAPFFFAQVTGVIANSFAAERMMALRWGWQGPTERVYYGFDDVLPLEAARKAKPRGNRVRLGSAARMIELKGHRIALYTLLTLRETHGIDATLAIAGSGEQESSLRAETERLGLSGSVEFEGPVADMADFYDRLDVMLVPSMVEPFGRTSMEAQARGCPVIVTAVDGLPETLERGNSVAQVTPDWTLQEYAVELGGDISTILPWAYDPNSDQLIEPRAVSPDRLADAVRALLESDEVYSEASLSGLRNARARFMPEDYGPAVDEAVAKLLAV